MHILLYFSVHILISHTFVMLVTCAAVPAWRYNLRISKFSKSVTEKASEICFCCDFDDVVDHKEGHLVSGL